MVEARLGLNLGSTFQREGWHSLLKGLHFLDSTHVTTYSASP